MTHVRRAVGMGIIAYFVSFVIGIITTIILGGSFTLENETPMILWVINLVLSILLMYVFGVWYFRDEDIKPSVKEGLILGIIFLGVGFIIDIILALPFILSPEVLGSIFAYYLKPLFWVTMAVMLITAMYVGRRLQKQEQLAHHHHHHNTHHKKN